MKKLQYTTNDPSASTDYLAADNTWKTIPGGGGGSGIPKGTTSGTDTYTTTISGVTAYNDGDAYLIRFSIGNTTGCTLNINSLGAKDLYRNNNGLLVGGDIIDGAEMFCIYNSTLNGFQVIGTAPNTLLAYVTNADSVTITKGQPVYAFGGTGDRLTVKLAYNTTDATSAQTVGLVLSSSIAANQKGLIIVSGQLDGLNIFPTSTWADGDAVYLGATAGTVTKTKPSAPNHLVYLGFVTTASNGSAGRMYVRVQNGYELDEIHDVKITSPSNGQLLSYNSTSGLWVNSTPLTALQKAALGYEYYNDFLSTPTANGSSDGFGYIYFFSGASAAVLSTSVPTVRASNQHGFIRPTTGSTNTGYAGIYGGTSNNQFLMGGGAMTFQTSVLVNTLSTGTERYRVVIGYGDQATNLAEVNGIFFTYDEGGTANGAAASPNWQCVTTANSVRTLTTSTVPVSTSAWHYLRIEINAAGTSVDFYINGILQATHMTNIPSGTSQTVTPRVNISKTIGTTSRFFHMDYLYYSQTYTTAKTL